MLSVVEKYIIEGIYDAIHHIDNMLERYVTNKES